MASSSPRPRFARVAAAVGLACDLVAWLTPGLFLAALLTGWRW